MSINKEVEAIRAFCESVVGICKAPVVQLGGWITLYTE